MEKTLQLLGLNAKEAKFYLFLLANRNMNASEIARQLEESRTNTYMILDKLLTEGLVHAVGNKGVKQYTVANPNELKKMVVAKQQEVRRDQQALSSILPELMSTYQLSQHRPGVVYLEGIKGFESFLEDMYKTGEEVSIIASNTTPQNREAWDVLQKALKKRKQKSIASRAIFHESACEWLNKDEYLGRGLEVRFWGGDELKGEIVLYGDKVALTVYEPAIIVTVITNEILAQTFQSLFDHIWQSAKI